MKKLFLAAFAVFAFASVNAQEFNAGISAALPIGDAGDGWTFGVNVDLNYLWEVSDDFQAGVTAGVGHYFGDEIGGFEIEDATFLPIGAAGRFAVSEEFTLGADLGYGIGLAPDGNDGGFYYAPRVQYGVSDALDIVLAYRGVSLDGGSFDAITLGVEFGL
ncbi:outer membrane beta-barrel protein [Winogradskyella sp.]|uniref:outer membrane beta-barrel protein n=1 Tax=Winogradskyella sp. TaxID=1883156 RepID=UPI003517ADA2